MREGRREKWSGCGGRGDVAGPLRPAEPWKSGPLPGDKGSPGTSMCHGGEARAEDAPNSRAPMSLPQSTPTPRHHQKIPREHRDGAGWLPPVLPEAAGGGRKGGRPPRTPPARDAPHAASAAFGLTIIPCSPAGGGRCPGLAQGGGLAGLETRNYSVFGLGNVFLMSHIMFFKLCWNH